MKKRLKPIAFITCFLMFFSFMCGPFSIRASANEAEIANLNSRANNIKNSLAALESEQKRIQNDIAGAKSKVEEATAKKIYIDRQISLTKEQILGYEELITNLSEAIELKQLDIDAKLDEYYHNYELFKSRLQAMYMFGDASTLGLLFGTQSFADFLSKTDTISRVAEHDNQLMELLMAQKIELDAQQADLEAQKEEQESFKKIAEEKESELVVQTTIAANEIQEIKALEAQFTADLAKAKAQAAAMTAELNEVYRQIEWSKNPYIGGVMRWPVDNFPKISSYYGWRFGGSDFHTGIDIAGSNIYGQPVRAANAGTIRVANWSYSPGRGYGIYVLIDHGGKVSTLYAHLSNITVNVGDVVSQGQTIGNVGSTGWSTGPHLHFEIREDSVHKDPLGYLKG